MDKLATPQQIARIVQMHASKQLPFDATQKFIRAHSNKRSKKDPDTERIAFWEERFPGKGEALMDVFRPFYDWSPELNPVFPDLEARGKKAIFWREIASVRVFRMKDGAALRDSLKLSLWYSLEDSFWAALPDSLRDSLEDSFGAALPDSLIRASLWAALPALLEDPLWASLWASLSFILADKPEEAAKLKPLLDLWLAGNFPAGFDKEGNLLVLVAD